VDPFGPAGATVATFVVSHGPVGHVLAYLDPGTGSLLIQALIAGALTVPFILRRQMRAGIARLRGRPVEDQAATQGRTTPS
jgi:hypothetical protein